MDHVLTLVAPVDGLDDGMIARLRQALADLGADSLSPRWLAKGRAADLPFSLLSPCQADAAARQLFSTLPIDVIAQSAGNRRKSLLLADMDSTTVSCETLDELADFAGLKDAVAAITDQSMNGKLDFETALRQRVALLAGLEAAALDGAWTRVALTAGARTLVSTMKANGATTILVSGGFCYFTERVAALCGFDRHFGNDLDIQQGRLTGRLSGPVLDRAAKLRTLLTYCADRQQPLGASLAVGDGANDLDMIKAAGLGVAFHAKPIVAAQALARIDHGDLTALLFAQGYAESDFIS